MSIEKVAYDKQSMCRHKEIIKPCKECHFYFILGTLAIFLLGAIVLLIICAIIDTIQIKGVIYVASAYGCVLILCIIAYFVTRLVYPIKYVIDDNGITRYKGKRVQFFIPKEDIIELGYRKTPKLVKLFTFFNWFFGDPLCDIVSIRIKTNNIPKRIFDSHYYIQSLSQKEQENGMKEYCELFTLKQLKRIQFILNLRVVEIDLTGN